MAPEERKIRQRAAQKKYKEANRELLRQRGRTQYAKNPEKSKAATLRWHAQNKERLAAYNKEWSTRNKDKIGQRQRRYRAENKNGFKEKETARRHKNIDKLRITRREQYKANPHQRLSHNRNRIAKKKAGGRHSAEDISNRRKWQKGKCAYCKVKLGAKHHVDHIKPLALGGTNEPSNLQILCIPCNLKKQAKPPEKFAREMGMLL